MRQVAILDKSYLQAVRQEQVQALCAKYRVLMTEALFFELLTADPAVRSACFRKFPSCDNPVGIVSHVGTLLAHEIETGQPCTPVWDRRAQSRFRFNKRLADPSFVYGEHQRAGIGAWETDLETAVAEFKQRCAATHGWFPCLQGYVAGAPPTSIHALQLAVFCNRHIVSGIYEEIRGLHFPPASMIDERWALYRWVQVHVFYALEYIRKYGADEGDIDSSKLPNDVVDAQYAITGILAGALASKDLAMKRVFRLGCPGGLLIDE